MQITMFWTDSGVIKSACDRIYIYRISLIILQQKAFETVRYTWNASVAAERLTDLARMLMEEWGIEEGRCGMPSKVPGKAVEIPWKTGPCSIETVRDESVVRDNALKYRS